MLYEIYFIYQLQERLKKKSKGKKKKSTNPGDVSTNSNASVLDASTVSVAADKGPSAEEAKGGSQQAENGPSQLTNSTPDTHYGLESDLPSYNDDGVKAPDPPQVSFISQIRIHQPALNLEGYKIIYIA